MTFYNENDILLLYQMPKGDKTMAEKAKEKAKKYYTLDHDKQFVTVDTTVKPAKGDSEAVKLYVSMGYKMRIKSQVRAEKMRDKADTLKAADIREALKNDKAGLAKFNNIIKGKEDGYKKGFFAARKWYKEYAK